MTELSRRTLRQLSPLLLIAVMALGSGCAAQQVRADPQQGKELYARECASCHGDAGNRIPAVPLNSRDFVTRIGQGDLAAAIRGGKGSMPAWGKDKGGPLTDDQVSAVVAYLLSNDGLSGGFEVGKTTYAKACASCHGEKGDRIPAVPLNSKAYLDAMDDAVLVRTISRGKDTMPALGKDREGPLGEVEIQAVVSYLRASVGARAPVLAATAAPARTAQASVGPPPEPGKTLYSKSCLNCHGEQGDKLRNINLSSSEFLNKRGEETLLKSIAEGRGVMPAFAQEKAGALSAEEVKQVYGYVRYLAQLGAGQPQATAGQPSPAPASAVPGGTPPPPPGAVRPASGQTSPPDIPHGVQGREDTCLNCHGRQGVKPVKVSHAGRTSIMCLYCHRVMPGVQEKPAGAPRGSGPPPIPHPLEGRADKCQQCHGPGGFPPMPAGHERFDNQQCGVCHRLGFSPPPPTPVSTALGKELYRRSCASCHGDSGNKVPGVNLSSADFLRSQGDQSLAQTIAAGKGGRMPTFGTHYGGGLSDAQIGGIVNYLKSLAGPAPAKGEG